MNRPLRLMAVLAHQERGVVPWPGWAVTTRIDAAGQWEVVWKAVRCHRSQLAGYGPLSALTREEHARLWGRQTFYRAFSLASVGRETEHDLFTGLR